MLLLTSVLPTAQGQVSETDSLKKLLSQTRQDTTRVFLLTELTFHYAFFKSDTALILGQQSIDLAQKLQFSKGEIRALLRHADVLRIRGEFPQALEELLRAMQLSKETYNYEEEANCLIYIAGIYLDLGENRQALKYLSQSKKIYERISKQMLTIGLTRIGMAYEKLNLLDSALYFQQLAHTAPIPRSLHAQAVILGNLGTIYNRLGNRRQALHYYQQAVQLAFNSGDIVNGTRSQYQIAELYYNLNKLDSSFHYAQLSFVNAKKSARILTLLNASSLLSKLYKTKGSLDSAYHYQQIEMSVKDSLFGAEKFQKLQLLNLTEQQRVQQIEQRQKEIQQEQERSKNRISTYALLSVVVVFLLLAIILYRNNRQKQKVNALLQYQKDEIQKNLAELKAAQTQLIQSEKMASLGELTAGIAHEIQNPLNFVNNFSEVNKEMIEEATEEIDKGNYDEVKSILNDIKDNSEKINHHGKRADAIVKNMLQHSRSSSSQKESTDINKLADEYLRLSYQGMRAKDKDFNATIKTNFDEMIGKLNIIPQDIGRVLLNLYNNAFYAVAEKKKHQPEGYEPTVSVSTKKINDKVEIIVKDNGNGIPGKVIDKIFQPFFTTKPTGQGTGLGLSLSYDIIKAHGGEISVGIPSEKVETKEGEGTGFIIQLRVHFKMSLLSSRLERCL
jgi:signal transduction histidine kinase